MAGLKIPVTQNDHILGRDDAALTFLEYGDYECPHCGRAHPVVKAVKKHFGNQLRYVYRHFPLTQIHPNAEPAAESAEFAGRRDRFWEMHDYIFQNQDGLGLPLLGELAEELGLSSLELLQALQSRTYAPIVREHFMGGVRSGVNGTPTFFINGQRYEGPYEFEYLVEAIDEELARVNTGRRRAG